VNLLLRSVDEDKSKGVHNFSYTQKVIAKAEEKVLTAKNPAAQSLD